MSAREHLEKHLRKIPGGGIAWDRGVFATGLSFQPVDLIDAAVDIAWDRLMPVNALERPPLDVTSRGDMVVFRVCAQTIKQMLRATA